MKLIPNSVSRKVGRQILVAKKNSPHIFFAVGVAGVIGSTVLACRATLKLEETIDEIKEDVDSVNSAELKHAQGQYDEGQHSRDRMYVYGKSAVKIGKLYGPSVVLGAASIGALTGSHVQMTRRNAALTVTLGAVSKAFEEYRERVQAEIGEDKELDVYRNAKELKDESSKKVVKVFDPNGLSPYARIFDETCPEWKKDAELNRLFIQCQQNYMNHLLQARGHVFLNEVYDSLGFERSQAGQVVGWVLNGEGDNFIDFGLFEAASNRFINGIERSIILDFNVDGVVFDKI